MRDKSVVAKLLPALAVLGVLAASALATPAQVFGFLTGYSYGYGGTLTSGVGASIAATRADVFVRGTDAGLWDALVISGVFGGWSSLGGTIQNEPGSVSPTTGTVYVYAEGATGAIWTRIFSGGVWGPWNLVPTGTTISGPAAAASFGGGILRIDLFVRGVDGTLWTRTSADGMTWGSWSALGGVSTERPGAVALGAGRVDALVRGTDNGLWDLPITGGVPGTWVSLGGTLLSGPAVASCSPGHMDVYVVGSGGNLWHRGYNGAWLGWDNTNLGGVWTSNLGVICAPGTTNITIFGRGTDNGMWSWSATGT